MKSMLKIGAFFLTGVLTAGMWTGCSDDTEIDDIDDGATEVVESQPTDDEVKVTFKRKVSFLGVSADYPVVNYLAKRMPQATTTLDAGADVVVISESVAAQLIDDEAQYPLLEELWFKDKPFAFIRPAAHCLKLFAKLSGKAVEDIPQDRLDAYKNLSICIMKASGDRFMHEKFHSTYTYLSESVEVNDKDETVEAEETMTIQFTPNAFHWGMMAENICAWLEKNTYTEAEGRAHPAFQSRAEMATAKYNSITYCPSVTVKYDSYGTDPEARTVTPSITVMVASGYDATNSRDVYDIKVEERFPANETFIKNTVTQKKAAYKYKYTGGFYKGPDVKLSLTSTAKDFDMNSNVQFLDPVPMQKAGEYSETHYPGNWTLGGSLSASAGYKELGGSLGFSASYTMPTTTVSTVSSEMPVEYSESGGVAKWESSLKYGDVYTGKWGLNKSYQGVPEISTQMNNHSQMVGMAVNNSRELGDATVKLKSEVTFKCQGESASPFHKKSETIKNTVSYDTELPEVFRYYKKYSPYPYKMEADADSEYWPSLEALLMGNVNYKSFKDDNLTVGASTESGVDVTALKIWKETVSALVKLYNGNKMPKYDYIVALADADGNRLSVGLEIKKDGTWRQVDLE